jgi:cytoskeletal protein RodZ
MKEIRARAPDGALESAGAVRRQRGISLQQIARRTKISMYYLRAIEAGNFGELPGGIYSRSYIRQYANCVGIDGSELLALYESQASMSETIL